jgi:hypothetical protein
MFEQIEVRSVENGFVVSVGKDGTDREYVFDTSRKVLRFIKDLIESKAAV